MNFHIPFSRTIKQFLEWRKAANMIIQYGWVFSNERLHMLIHEFADMKANYLPMDVKGLTVLDVGAGEGETALFYLAHGAEKVICVEANPSCFENLRRNCDLHREISSVLAPFDLFMLDFPHDFMKMDIEGYEEMLLARDLQLPAPSVIEVHGLQLRDKFAAKGFRIGKRIMENGKYWSCSTSYAYWRC